MPFHYVIYQCNSNESKGRVKPGGCIISVGIAVDWELNPHQMSLLFSPL